MPSLDPINKVLFYFSVLHFSVERSGQQKNVGQKNVRLVPSSSRTFWFTLQILSPTAEATLLMRSFKKVPGDRNMRAIPRWARVALAARTLRRVQPLLLVSWPKATRKFQRAVEWAIAEGESAATQGSPTPDLQDAGSAAVKVLGDRPMNAVTAYYLAAAASGVSSSGQQLSASRAQYALEEARLAVYFFDEDHDAPGAEQATIEAIWNDFQQLKKASKREKWTDLTTVAPDFFGPMWPNGLPRNWPAAPVTPPAPVAKRPRRKPKVDELGLPAEFIAFLRAGRQLDFDHRQTEVGPVRLKPLTHLRFEEFAITTEGTPLERKDPHRGEAGHYVLRVIDLIGESESYYPTGLLAWFYDYGSFGAWDGDHLTAFAFPKVSWSKIVADPAKYLDAPWQLYSNVAKYIEPWKHCEFKED